MNAFNLTTREFFYNNNIFGFIPKCILRLKTFYPFPMVTIQKGWIIFEPSIDFKSEYRT